MAIYYIDPDVAPGGTGTEVDPYSNWSEVTLGASDTIYFQRGTTHLLTYIDVSQAGVTLDAYGTGQAPILDCTSNGQSYGIIVNALSTIQNLTISGEEQTATVAFSGSSTGATIDNCTITTNQATYGIWVLRPAIIQNCTITGSKLNGPVIRFQDTATYTGGSVLNNIINSTATPKSTTTIIGLDIIGWGGITITGNTFGNSDGLYRGIQMDSNDNSGQVIQNNTFGSIYDTNIYMQNAASSNISNNIITSGQTGIYLLTTDTSRVSYNTINNTTVNGIVVNNSDSNRIHDNQLTDIWDNVAYPGGTGEAIQMTFGCTLNKIYRNKFTRCNKAIIDQTTVGGHEIYGNLAVDSHVNGIDIQGTGATQTTVTNNTVIHRPSQDAGHGIVFQVGGVNSDVRFHNNICYCNIVGASNVQAYCFAGTYSNLELDNNYYLTDNTAVKIAKHQSTEYDGTEIAAYLAALDGDAAILGQSGAGSPEVNSIFQTDGIESTVYNPSYGLVANSPAIAVGFKLGIIFYETLGEPIPCTTPDLGAYHSSFSPFHPRQLNGTR